MANTHRRLCRGSHSKFRLVRHLDSTFTLQPRAWTALVASRAVDRASVGTTLQ
jgi:hypothetical protein